jgi:hypothetical protein
MAFDGAELFEIRPAFQSPKAKIEHGIAKATYVKSQDKRKVYWLRADLKWHRYEPNADKIGARRCRITCACSAADPEGRREQ